MTIFVHIGPPKTASTTIQNALVKSDMRKKCFSYLYSLGSVSLSIMCAETYKENLAQAFGDILQQQSKVNKASNLLISSERLCGNSSYGYLNSRICARIVKRAIEYFDDQEIEDIKIIIYLRRQDELIESLYREIISEGHQMSFDEFFNQLKPGVSFNYQRILEDWAYYFGEDNLIVRSYHRAAQKGILRDFGEVIGLPDSIKGEEVQNIGLSYCAMQIAQIANKKLDGRYEKRQLNDVLRKTLPKRAGNEYNYLSKEARKHFLENYIESNTKVIKNFFSDYSYDDVFPVLKSRNPIQQTNEYKGISYNEVANLMTNLIHQTSGKGSTLKNALQNARKVVKSR